MEKATIIIIVAALAFVFLFLDNRKIRILEDLCIICIVALCAYIIYRISYSGIPAIIAGLLLVYFIYVYLFEIRSKK